MARPKLASADQPLWLRLPLRLYEFAASLSLAVILISTSAFALGLATFIEAAWGAPVVQFYVYQTWWFELILVLLAINIFCAAAIRYPWKRHQTGFVITHIGLLTLLFGAFMGRFKGIDAQVSVFEGQMDPWAVENAVQIEMAVTRPGKSEPERIDVRYDPGLFTWDDWSDEFAFDKPEDEHLRGINKIAWQSFRSGSGAIFRLAKQTKPGDVLYNRDGIKLEALDYYADSNVITVPHVKLMMSMPKMAQMTEDGKTTEKMPDWVPVEFSLESYPQAKEYPFGWMQTLPLGGGALTFQLAGSPEQQRAFLECLPEGPLGKKGQVVLLAGGEVTRIDVAEKLNQGRIKLPGNFEAEVSGYWGAAKRTEQHGEFRWDKTEIQKPFSPVVEVTIYRGQKEISKLTLSALEPQSNVVDHDNKIYGEFWFDHGDQGELSKEDRKTAKISPRLDFLAGADGKVYARYWNWDTVVYAREMPADGDKEDAVDAFSMPAGKLRMYVDEFIASDKPQVVPAGRPFVKGRLIGDPVQGGRQPAGKFALTVDGEREEFWLFPFLSTPGTPPVNRPNGPQRIQLSNGKDGRVVSLMMPITAIDIGFRVRLNKFERKLDPGTEQASHFASWVDFVDRYADRALCRLPQTGRKAEMLTSPQLTRPRHFVFGREDGNDGRYVYWIDDKSGDLRGANWDQLRESPRDFKAQVLLEGAINRPAALAIDSDGTAYYVDRISTQRETGVLRSTKNGKAESITTLAYVPEALALDEESGYLYFAGRGSEAIGRVNLKDGKVQEGWFVAAAPVRAMVFDEENEELLFAETRGSIKRLSLERRDKKLLSIGREASVLELAIDREGKRLYYFEQSPNPPEDRRGLPTSKPLRWRLMSASLDGDDQRVECDENIDEPQGLAFDHENKPVWTQTALTRDDVWITMNAPVDCFDPDTGRSYRLFQESFRGPAKPGEFVTSTLRFEDLVPDDSLKTELYESVLTVNYDPGRGIRNVGCLLVCCGIATMFYMRAYFFKPKLRATPPTAQVMTAEAVPQNRSKKKSAAKV